MYADDADRFRRDPAGEMHEQKLEVLRRQQVRDHACVSRRLLLLIIVQYGLKSAQTLGT